MQQHVGLIHPLLIVQIRTLVFLLFVFLLKSCLGGAFPTQIGGLGTVGVAHYTDCEAIWGNWKCDLIDYWSCNIQTVPNCVRINKLLQSFEKDCKKLRIEKDIFEKSFTFFSELPLPLCRLFVDLKRLSDPALRDHLQLDSPSKPELSIQTFPYESVYTELQAICATQGPKDKVWICDKASCALTQVIPKVRGHRHT